MDYTGNLPCDIADVVELLGIRVVRNTGTQLHCKCPFCDDRKAHLNINLGKNVFRCNRCGKGGGVLHLYAEANGISLNAAYEERMRAVLERGRIDYATGRFIEGTDSALAEIERRAAARV